MESNQSSVPSFQKIITSILLVGSFVVFAAGAAVPAFGGVWSASDEEAARWIASHPGGWSFATTAFITSIVMVVAGLAVFTDIFLKGDTKLLGKVGFYSYFIGGIALIIIMAFRLSVVPLGAELLVETGVQPDYLNPFDLLTNKLFDIFNVTTFVASSIFGLALLKSPEYSNGVGWFAIAYGIFGVFTSPIPIMVLVVPLLLGIILLLEMIK